MQSPSVSRNTIKPYKKPGHVKRGWSSGRNTAADQAEKAPFLKAGSCLWSSSQPLSWHAENPFAAFDYCDSYQLGPCLGVGGPNAFGEDAHFALWCFSFGSLSPQVRQQYQCGMTLLGLALILTISQQVSLEEHPRPGAMCSSFRRVGECLLSTPATAPSQSGITTTSSLSGLIGRD